MTASSTLGMIVTFYSWKGGVGRTMALANTAIQLARKGNRVLMVDWDLEAPGLGKYFEGGEAQQTGLVSATGAKDDRGLIGMLSEAQSGRAVEQSLWRDALQNISIPPDSPSYRNPTPPTPGRLDLLPSGYGMKNYAKLLSDFSWTTFFLNGGGPWVERIRRDWGENYEFVLIDSRTGLTDSGGVCTIQMPDVLVLVFTANDQSLEGGLKVVSAAQDGRRSFAYERPPLKTIPLLSRWEGEAEVDLAEQWMKRFDLELKGVVGTWLPEDFSPRDFLEKFRVPHVARFSFGEPLPVITHTLTDANLPGLAYESLARLLHGKFANAGVLIDPAYRNPPQYLAGMTSRDDAVFLALVSDPLALSREVGRLSRLNGPQSKELARFLRRAGSTLDRLAHYAEAEPLKRRALAMSETIFGPDHPEVAADLNSLAGLLRDTNRLSEAEPLYRRALAIDEESFGPDSPDVAAILNNLAILLLETNRLDEAEPLVRRALAIGEASYGPDDPRVAVALNNLARLLRQTNRLNEAESLYRRALAIDEASHGPDHPAVATALSSLAGLLRQTNRLTEAEPLYRRALTIDEASYGPDHPDFAADLNELAGLLRQTNRLSEAEPLYRRALAIGEASYGPDHPKVAAALNNLAGLLQQTNRLSEAEPLHRRALAIDEASYGPDHPEVAIDLNNLAGLLRETNRQSEAEALYRRALAIDRASYGPDHPRVATVLNNLAGLLRETNRQIEAEALYERARGITTRGASPSTEAPEKTERAKERDPSRRSGADALE